MLVKAGLWRTDSTARTKGYTLAAALLFGKEELLQQLIPAYKIDALVRRENLDRYDDRLNIRVNLIDAYDLLMEFIAKHLPDPFHLEGAQRINLREKIFREVPARAPGIHGCPAGHRDYLSGSRGNYESRHPPWPWADPSGPVYSVPEEPDFVQVLHADGPRRRTGIGHSEREQVSAFLHQGCQTPIHRGRSLCHHHPAPNGGFRRNYAETPEGILDECLGHAKVSPVDCKPPYNPRSVSSSRTCAVSVSW